MRKFAAGRHANHVLTLQTKNSSAIANIFEDKQLTGSAQQLHSPFNVEANEIWSLSAALMEPLVPC